MPEPEGSNRIAGIAPLSPGRAQGVVPLFTRVKVFPPSVLRNIPHDGLTPSADIPTKTTLGFAGSTARLIGELQSDGTFRVLVVHVFPPSVVTCRDPGW